MADDQRLRTILRRQDGLITAQQALSCGLSRSAIQRRVSSSTWNRVVAGVFRDATHPHTPATRVRIAVLSAGSGATLAGAAAAWWLQLTPAFPSTITVCSPARGRHVRMPVGARARHRDLHDIDVTERAGIRVTTPALTVLDAALETGPKVVDDALLRGHVSLDRLQEVHARYRGRHGAQENQRMLVAMTSGARSAAERVLVDLLRSAGITGWVMNHRVAGYVVDAAFGERRLAVEIDGFAFHTDSEVFQRDRRKQNDLIAAGWTVLRFTWADLTRRPHEVLARILAA